MKSSDRTGDRHLGCRPSRDHRTITTALVSRNPDVEALGKRLDGERGINVTLRSELSEIGTRADRIDCIVCGPDVVDSRIAEKKREVPASAWIVLYEDNRTAERALSAGVDRCVHWGDDRNATVAHLATALRAAIDTREAKFTREALRRSNDLFFVFDPDGNLLQWNDRLPEVTGYDGDEIASMSPSDFVADEDVAAIEAAVRRVLESGSVRTEADLVTKDGEEIPYEFTGALLDTEEGARISGIGRDITDRKRRQHALAEQAEQLRTVNHINAVIREVNQALVRASTREEIEEAVCTHLAKKEPYRFAWIGEQGAASDHVTPRAWAGIEKGYLEDRPDVEAQRGDHITAATAIRTGEIQTALRIAEDPEFEPWREAALERGFRSAIAVPLRYRETTYGVLCVYAPRPEAFDKDEQAVLADLGETVAYAISAAERRRALVTNSVIELEFLTRDRSIGYVALSAELGCELTVEGVSPTGDGEVAAFITISGANCETVLSTVGDDPDVEATVVADHGKECVFRLTGPEPSVSGTIADYGGVVREADADDGEGRFVVELPYDADVRAVVDGLEEYYDRTELVAQRERERTEPSDAVVREAFDDALTDRQREVLRAAYLSGFFDWPRGANSGEVAEVLGITEPTFHEHLRTCQRKLISAYFDHQPPVDLAELMA
ncbi:putative PAS/PAC sensor protein [Natronococcus amylolyticus DSM 10524]|uniref:Putative PAS/PAC sensor protein n=1 Tax=Natronococcus amylolyticus DSM 10524 TaxID=1227497 RepID=L9X5T0_9EURY|nr:bacterio-opsin activator domain-containing protein [Natronococcus amylolyticus]ELY56821.1 putative PAS/PAC sensor protein [Natronococcus amylolyticus DSM 10524]